MGGRLHVRLLASRVAGGRWRSAPGLALRASGPMSKLQDSMGKW